MLSPDTILLFLTLCMSLCLIPSPEMVIVVVQSSLNGKMAGITFICGVCTALVLQVLVMALGISAIIQTSVTVFIVLKVVGVCYLLFLAVQAYNLEIRIESKESDNAGLLGLYRKGVGINLFNPMNPLFLLVVFPNFVNADQGAVFFQLIQLGILLIIALLIMYSIMSAVAEMLGKKLLQSKRIQFFLQKGAAATIAGFAVVLAFSQQSL